MEIDVSEASPGMHVRCGYCESLVRVPELVEEDMPIAAEADPAKVEPISSDRPRRRRRPRPKPRKVWPILALVVLVLFGLCGGSAGLFAWATRPQWRQYDSPGGGFSVELPAAPRKDMSRLAGVKDNEGSLVEGTLLLGRLEDYAIVYGEIDPVLRRTKSDDQIIQDAVDAMVADKAGSRILHDVRVTVSNLPAREIGLAIPGDGQVLSRIVVAGTRFYIVAAGGRFASYNDPRLRRFIDSFRITGAKPAQQWR